MFKYEVGDSPFRAAYLDAMVDKYGAQPYNLGILEAQEKALEVLASEGMLKWMEIK